MTSVMTQWASTTTRGALLVTGIVQRSVWLLLALVTIGAIERVVCTMLGWRGAEGVTTAGGDAGAVAHGIHGQ